MRAGGERHAPTSLPPRNTQYLLHRELGGSLDEYGNSRPRRDSMSGPFIP
jgi:hypothetical protein